MPPLPRSALPCPSLPRDRLIGAVGGSWDAPGCDSARGAPRRELTAVAVAPGNNDFKVLYIERACPEVKGEG